MLRPRPLLQKALSLILSFALVALAPGLGAYEALAEIRLAKTQGAAPARVTLPTSSLSVIAPAGVPGASLGGLPGAGVPSLGSAQSQFGPSQGAPTPAAALFPALFGLMPTPATSGVTSPKPAAALLDQEAQSAEAARAGQSGAQPGRRFDRSRAMAAGSETVQGALGNGVAPLAKPESSKRRWAIRAGLAAAVAALGYAPLKAQGHLTDSTAAGASAAGSASGLAALLAPLGWLGDKVGNALAFVLAWPQLYKTAVEGHAKGTPFARAMMLVAASLSLGLLVAPVAEPASAFWGIQNIFGALTMLAVYPIAAWLARRGGGLSTGTPAPQGASRLSKLWHRLKTDRALQLSLGVMLLAAPLAAGIYYAGAALLAPQILAAFPLSWGASFAFTQAAVMGLGAAGVAWLASKLLFPKKGGLQPVNAWETGARGLIVLAAAWMLLQSVPALALGLTQLAGAWTLEGFRIAVQSTTALMFLSLFLPDLKNIRKGKPGGFTPAFSLLFFISSVAFFVWTAHQMLVHPVGSGEFVRNAIYTGVNILYAGISWVSFKLALRNKSAGEAGAAPSPRPADDAVVGSQADLVSTPPSPEAQKASAAILRVLDQQAKGGAPVRRLYIFLDSEGGFERADQSPRGSGISLEYSVDADGRLALAAGQHNAAAKGRFKSRRIDGFARAQDLIGEAEALVQAGIVDARDAEAVRTLRKGVAEGDMARVAAAESRAQAIAALLEKPGDRLVLVFDRDGAFLRADPDLARAKLSAQSEFSLEFEVSKDGTLAPVGATTGVKRDALENAGNAVAEVNYFLAGLLKSRPALKIAGEEGAASKPADDAVAPSPADLDTTVPPKSRFAVPDSDQARALRAAQKFNRTPDYPAPASFIENSRRANELFNRWLSGEEGELALAPLMERMHGLYIGKGENHSVAGGDYWKGGGAINRRANRTRSFVTDHFGLAANPDGEVILSGVPESMSPAFFLQTYSYADQTTPGLREAYYAALEAQLERYAKLANRLPALEIEAGNLGSRSAGEYERARSEAIEAVLEFGRIAAAFRQFQNGNWGLYGPMINSMLNRIGFSIAHPGYLDILLQGATEDSLKPFFEKSVREGRSFYPADGFDPIQGAHRRPSIKTVTAAPAPVKPAADAAASSGLLPATVSAPPASLEPSPVQSRGPPASFNNLPKSARSANGASLAAAKADAQALAKTLRADAAFVAVTISLDKRGARWSFVFESLSLGEKITIADGVLTRQPLGRARLKPKITDGRLRALGTLADPYSRLKRHKRWFKPLTLEIVGSAGQGLKYAFTDGAGRTFTVPADARLPIEEMPRFKSDGSVGGKATAAAWETLPPDARGAEIPADLAAGKAAAQARARALAPDAQLVRVAINLDHPNGHWIYIFHSKSKRQILTVWEKRVGVETLSKKPASLPTIWNTRLARLGPLREAFATLKTQRPKFVPVRAEVHGDWKGDPIWVFIDALGRKVAVGSSGRSEQAPPRGPPNTSNPGSEPPETTPAPEAPQRPGQTPTVQPIPAGDPSTASPVDQTAAPPAASPPGPPSSPPANVQASASPPGPRVFETFTGRRFVRGLLATPGLGPLPAEASSAEIVDYISKKYKDIARARVLELGALSGLSEQSPAAGWWSLLDGLERPNRAAFERDDNGKYKGWGSFRALENAKYPAGWKGTLLRMRELHKHFLGFFVRLPYHLFDMFFFGYFRRATAYQAFHHNEDFLSLHHPGLAEKYLQKAALERKALVEAAAKGGRRAALAMRAEALTGKVWARHFDRIVLKPVLGPLYNFMKRRVTLAILSAVAMGALGALAPGLTLFGVPILALKMTSIPILGDGLVLLGQGVPVALGWIPFFGDALAKVAAEATNALINDLVLGPMLNTLILTSMLTFPRSLRERVLKVHDGDPHYRFRWLSLETARASFWAAVSWDFWASNWKSWFAMITVGAEIKGIMAYADEVDGAVDPAWKRLGGEKFGLFHTVGGAIELPEGQSAVPFGGAITWGNGLLEAAQNALGFKLADSIAGLNPGADGELKGAAERVAKYSGQRGGPEWEFDPELHKKDPAVVEARLRELAGRAGDLGREIEQAQERVFGLEKAMLEAERKADELRRQRQPLSEEEQREYERLRRERGPKAAEDYIESKLAQRRELQNPQSDELAAIKRLKELQAYYDNVLPQALNDKPGETDALAVKEASLKALQEHLSALAESRLVRRTEGAAPPADEATLETLGALVAEIETMRVEIRGEMANRDAVNGLLGVANKSRNEALRDRRDYSEMFEMHKNMAKLATVMDLAFSLNEIHAAQKALKDMMELLDAKETKIRAAKGLNEGNKAEADKKAAEVETWREELRKEIADDADTKETIVENEGRAGLSVARFRSFRDDMSAYLSRVNARDGGASGQALVEYQRRLDLLPQVIAWRTNGGNPNDPDAFSLKRFETDLAEVNTNIRDAEDGLRRIGEVPVEFAGALIVLIPGPKVDVNNPSLDQTLQILTDRKAHWQAKKVDYQKSLDSVARRLDPSNTRTVVDEFGDSNPESLPRWRAQEAAKLELSSTRARQLAAQIDALAAQVNAASGASLPPLSGLTLEQYQDAIKSYGDAARAVKIADSESTEGHLAQMNLVSIAKLIPHLADDVITWSKADATVSAIDDASSTTLPEAKAKLTRLVGLIDTVLADVEADRDWINNGGDGQALIDRKTALLANEVLPTLREMKGLLENSLIPFQNDAIDTAQPNSGKLWELFDAQKELMTEAEKLYKRTIPWAIASFGGEEGNAAASHASIKDWRDRLKKYVTGYDDAEGHHKGVAEFQQEVANRKDPNFTGTELLYGETQPYSLPKKIEQYTAERAQRAEQINQQSAQINEILGKIETISKGKYNLQAFRLPTGVGTDQASVDRVDAMVDAKTIPNLADELKRIGDESNTSSGDITIGGGDSVGPPVGTQPPITIGENQQIALLALEAAKRLVPTSLDQPQSAPGAYAVARFLYSDAVVSGSRDALETQIPAAERFLNRARAALDNAVAKTADDDAYVSSNGTSETPEQVYARKIATFSELQAFLAEGIAFFDLKGQWNQDKFATIDEVGTYYSSLQDIYEGGGTAGDSELEAVQKMRDALKKTFDELEAKRVKLNRWMGQLNDPHESALRRVSESISELQTKTRQVLETNFKWHELKEQLDRSNEILRARMTRIDEKQRELAEILGREDFQDRLPPELVRRIEALRLARGAWSMDGQRGTEAIVIKKSEFNAFLDTVLKLFGNQVGPQNLGAIKQDLLANPSALTTLIPNSQMIDYGDTADGFYLVYQSQFAVPHGLDTASRVTLGNVGKVWGNNISVTGYSLASPPNEENAPYGDKGVEVQIESLQGKNWVNYLNVDFHRFAFDVPPDATVGGQARQSRLMVFDDFAMLLFGDRLYIGLAGFGDFALDDPMNKPHYYGGNLKTSLKLTEVMKLNYEQQELFAKDPRKFLQEVNLDFTGYDPDLNRNFLIEARGENKEYHRKQLGPSFDIGRLLGSQDSFTVDLFFADTRGTDDIEQRTLGATILKGFTIRDDSGKPWMVINNRATGELGEKFNTLTDRLSITLPEQGIVISGQGKLMGSAQAYYGEIAKKMGDNANIALGYGSPTVGQNNRLSLTMNTSFTLGELWQKVIDNSRDNLRGGETLKAYNKELADFFGDTQGPDAEKVAELKRLFDADVAGKLITQDIGLLTREISDLRRAGAVMDNTRVRGMVGFVSAPISDDVAERAVGGGFTVGTQTDLTLTKTQKALIEAKAENLYREGLRLQSRLIELTKEWQGSVAELAQAQWALKLAEWSVENAPSEVSRRDAEVRVAEARDRLHQASLRYNALTGRDPASVAPFADLKASELEALLGEIKKTMATPDRLTQVLHGLDREAMKERLGDNPFNIMDWIPWIDRFTIGIGLQYSDALSNQALAIGGSVRLPFYDPASKHSDKAYRLESKATVQEIEQMYDERRLAAESEFVRQVIAEQTAETLRPGLPAAERDLGMAIRGYRNGLIGPRQLDEAFASWRWYSDSVLEAEARGAVAEAWGRMDERFARPARPEGPLTLSSLNQAFDLVQERSHSLSEVALRQQAAAEMAKANDNRIQKIWLDLHVGAGLTATGVGWLPSVGITGIPVTPILGFEFKPEELRELQVKQGEGQSKYYAELKTKLEANLALQLYQNVLAIATGARLKEHLETAVIPALERELEQAGNGAYNTDKVSAQKRLDAAKLQRDQAELAVQQGGVTLNFLLDRPSDSPLSLQMDADGILNELEAILKAKDPVAAQERVLDARVEVAQAVETMIDKDLKVEQLSLEPVSLVVRSLGRLISTLGGDGMGNPELVAAARIQTLTEQRARESFPKQVEVEASRAWTSLSLARAELERLRGKDDPASRTRFLILSGQERQLIGALMALGVDIGEGGERWKAPRPLSFSELRERLSQSHAKLSARAPEAPVELVEPELLRHQTAGFFRYYWAKQTLGKNPIDKHYGEGWIEVRLKHHETAPEALIALAKLRQEKADRIYRNELAAAASRGEILAADFQTNVWMLRWAMETTGRPGIDFAGNLDEFARGIRERLTAQRDEIVALLGLDPDTTTEQLAALVPQDPAGSRELDAMADRFLDQIRDMQLERVKRTLFEDGLAARFGDEDDLMHQIRADTIAERMSYKGFTPVFAFGVFRGKQLWGGFLEAPDPRQIERGLENVLSDVLRKELQSTGRMQELALRLHSLMAKVEDGAHELQKRRELIEAAESDYRAQVGRARGAADLPEVEAARGRVVRAWMAFAEQTVRTKSDFIVLVSELEALGEARGPSPLRPSIGPARAEFLPLRKDPRSELLDFASERMADEGFSKALAGAVERVDGEAIRILHRRVEARAELYRAALLSAVAVVSKDFTPAEKLDLLARNDLEGKRQALRAELQQLLEASGPLDPARNPLVSLLAAELAVEAERATLGNARGSESLRAMRRALWGSPGEAGRAGWELEGAFDRLEAKHRELESSRQSLLESYLRDLKDEPSHFLLKDVKLDLYLRAQQDYDDELIKTYESDLVKKDPLIARRLHGLFDLRTTLSRQVDGRRSGRGLLALDALIMLEESRLLAARARQRPPQEIDRIASALQSLRMTKDRWARGKAELEPLYALTSVAADGRRLWTIDGWMTAGEIERERAAGRVALRDGRAYVRTRDGERELVGGVDLLEQTRDHAAERAQGNAAELELFARMKAHEFALDRRAPDGREGYTVAEIFGRDGKHRQGRVFFFEARREGDAPGKLRNALHPLAALRLSPDRYVMMVYEGSQSLSRDRYPTLESLLGSPEAADFRTLMLSEKGAKALGERALRARDANLRQGWVELKLTSYGFARDAGGKVVDSYLSEDDFKAVTKAFRNAVPDLADAQKELRELQEEASALKAETETKKETARVQGLRYQAIQAQVRLELESAVRSSIPPRGENESVELYATRLKLELDKRLAQDERFKDAQKAFEPFAKEYSDAARELEQIEAKVANGQTAVQDAETILARSRAWSLYESDQLALGLDRAGAVVEASARPVYGSLGLDETVGSGDAIARIGGPLLAAVLDEHARVREYYTDEGALERTAPGWTMRSVAFQGADDAASSEGGTTVNPTYRLSHYEAVVDGKRLPVLLSRRHMAERVDSAGSALTKAKHWGVMPWRWGSLILEIPRGVISAPVEILTGRDPRQHHYLGRVAMYKTEGGATEHHGFFRKAIGVIDVLNLLPDPVDRFYDPSQFPERVQVDSPVLPGEQVFEKDARAGDMDIHFGARSIERSLRHSVEDLAAARARTLSRFHGGVETVLVESVRGRAGNYLESSRGAKFGDAAVAEALSDPLIASNPNSGGGIVVTAARPGNLAVDRVERRVTIRPGASQYEAQASALEGYGGALGERENGARGAAPRLREEAAAAETSLGVGLERRGAVRGEAERLWERLHGLAWRDDARAALDREIARWEARAAELRAALGWWKGYLERLLRIRRGQPPSPPRPGDPTDPTNPGAPVGGFWGLVAVLFAALAVAAALWHCWRQRRTPPILGQS